jgi:hypothetical protein
MREIYRSGVTPQQKLVAVNNKFGNDGIKSQQGTSRIMYDHLVAGANTTTFRFFEDSASRTFPLTNTGSEGNKLGVGDTMVVAQILFTVVERNNTTGAWTIPASLAPTVSGALSLFSFEIANNKVIKKVTLTESLQDYNKDTTGQPNTVDLETDIVIPPLLNYVLELQLPAPLSQNAGFTKYIQAQIIGTGGIIAPRTTF